VIIRTITIKQLNNSRLTGTNGSAAAAAAEAKKVLRRHWAKFALCKCHETFVYPSMKEKPNVCPECIALPPPDGHVLRSTIASS
jgi:hypothetical protein